MGSFVNRDKQHFRQLKIMFYFVLSEMLTPIIPSKKYVLNSRIKIFTTLNLLWKTKNWLGDS